jgi:lysophospholipid acyltransferase (LPLAT)-like uncharacterized protein
VSHAPPDSSDSLPPPPPSPSPESPAPEPATKEESAGPQGSAFQESEARKSRRLGRRIRHFFSQILVWFAVLIVPRLYVLYCWFVWKTSRFEDGLTAPLLAGAEKHGGFVALLWHQEVFSVAYNYRHLHGSTLASTGNFGRLITRMLELCNFAVFRGGSSTGARRRRRILPAMIRYFRENERVCYGITVDGSKGPAFELKSGGLILARSCKAPVYLVRTWFSRRIMLNTWDRTAIPLPFGRIKSIAIGPFWVPPECDKDEFEAIRVHYEREMHELAERSFLDLDPQGKRELPQGFQLRWEPGQQGIPYGPHDLKPDDPPEWARKYGDHLLAKKKPRQPDEASRT